MKHSFTALCWAVMVAGVTLSACAKKPSQPGPPPEKVNGSESAIADEGRGRGHSLEDLGFRKASVSSVSFAPVYFALNSTRPEDLDPLHTLADEAPAFTSCKVEGHACPIGTTEYNSALGYHRAMAVVQYLRAAGVKTGFQIISYGEEKPATLKPEGYHLNRRVNVECSR